MATRLNQFRRNVLSEFADAAADRAYSDAYDIEYAGCLKAKMSLDEAALWAMDAASDAYDRADNTGSHAEPAQ